MKKFCLCLNRDLHTIKEVNDWALSVKEKKAVKWSLQARVVDDQITDLDHSLI